MLPDGNGTKRKSANGLKSPAIIPVHVHALTWITCTGIGNVP